MPRDWLDLDRPGYRLGCSVTRSILVRDLYSKVIPKIRQFLVQVACAPNLLSRPVAIAAVPSCSPFHVKYV